MATETHRHTLADCIDALADRIDVADVPCLVRVYESFDASRALYIAQRAALLHVADQLAAAASGTGVPRQALLGWADDLRAAAGETGT